MMKSLILSCIIIFSFSLKAQVEFCESEASIISRSMNKCGGCPGWLIKVNSDTIKVLSIPELESSNRLYIPIKAKLTVGEKQEMRSINYPYYDLICIRVPCEVEVTEELKKSFCTMDLNLVCGCDGETYGNPCEALKNGINVFSFGKCED